MRNLGVQLPPMRLERRGNPAKEIFHFIVAFVAMFCGALLALNVFF